MTPSSKKSLLDLVRYDIYSGPPPQNLLHDKTDIAGFSFR